MTITQKAWILIALVIAGVLVYYLQSILTPFLASFILAYLGNPLVNRLERCKIPRTAAVLVVFLATLLVLALVLMLVIPMVAHEVAALFTYGPGITAWVQRRVFPWIATHFGVQPASLGPAKLMAFAGNNLASAGRFAGNALLSVGRSSGILFELIMNLILIPVVTFYLLRDWNRLLVRIEMLMPRQVSPTLIRLARQCDEVLGAFMRGQLLVMVCLAIFYSIALSIIGLQNAAAIAVIAGVLSFVPYLGVISGITLALLTALLQGEGWPLLVEVVATFAVGQLLSDMVLTPRLVGERIGLHPVLVIFAILVGGVLFGFAGVLLALPAAAAITVLVRYAHSRYLDSGFYRGEDRAS